MELLNGLHDECNTLISALDAIDDEHRDLDWEFVKSRILQEEQRIHMRTKSALTKSEAAALVTQDKHPAKCTNTNCRNCGHTASTRPFCDHCKRSGHSSSKCWKKYPNLNAHKKPTQLSKPAFIASKLDDEPVVCLMAKYHDSSEPINSGDWYIDSGCSNYMTYDKSVFSSYSPGKHSSVELGNGKCAKVIGQGKVTFKISFNWVCTTCELVNVLLVQDLGYQLLSVPTLDKTGLKTSFYSRRCHLTYGQARPCSRDRA